MPPVNINFNNVEKSDSLEQYFLENISKLDNYLRDENVIHGELELVAAHKSGPFHRAEIIIMPNSEIFAEAHGNDFYEAIDLLMPKVKDQLIKQKDMAISERRKEGAELKDIESEVLNGE